MPAELPAQLTSLFRTNRERYEPKGLVIDLIRQCTEACRHCVVAASPQRRERIQLDQIETALDDAVRNGFVSASFYGGEPFAAKQLLYDAVGLTYKKGLHAQIMSNGYWGKSVALAHETFDRLARVQPPDTDMPISINLSTDEFHERVSLRNLANILTAWVYRHEPIDVNIAIGKLGNDGKTAGETLWEILDSFDDQNREYGVSSCMHADRLTGEESVRFIDKGIFVPTDIDLAKLLSVLRNEEMLPAETLALIEEYSTTAMDALRMIAANGFLKLVQDDECRRTGQYRIGRMMADKVVQIRTYSINLFGAGRDLQSNQSTIERAMASSARADRERNIHEYESLLVLGTDNRFYISPIHLQHRVKPLGENTGNAIEGIIEHVNDGEPVSNILMQQDVMCAEYFMLLANDEEGLQRFRELRDKGLIHEALEVFLMSEKTMASVPQRLAILKPEAYHRRRRADLDLDERWDAD